ETTVETTVKTGDMIVEKIKENPSLSLAEIAEMINKSLRAVERASLKLVKEGKIKHVGPKKGGHWEVTNGD
ncbi:MAG TPA: winged helix-turn-helix transcriptional regulator, partial [bacterium]|nr:winged helix-turn-helix transcriptional regulator [bacterium]